MHLLFERSRDGIIMFAYFKENHGNHKKKRVCIGFGARCLKIRDVNVWILKHISRFIAWSLFILKVLYFVKCPIST